ncbi:methyltransferase family protein [Herbihabitans rhizosphaerae]|uniref:Methyltransferase family protein n=1 Tax=Herbihabitans rhizosphaerae TaxID=1872711 RepID=A0A4Q7KL27_9PSEU|nr:class I SAM-dependent methyltransferase [Herbihabitans rhizosphaerae]RZS36924.1 methyltransferase family protein [Herbihabitans rhizosphaerae]
MTLDDDTRRMIAANQANWDQRTPIHVDSQFYGLDGTRDPNDWFADFEWDDLGDLAGKDLAHLQCHLGTETIVLAGRGAKATGLDISSESVSQARRIAEAAGVEIEYVRADVHDAVEVLGGQRFDIVYTGKGAICYLPDLPRWAGVVAGLLRPGGRVYVVEFHPLLNALGVVPPPDGSQDLLLRNDFLGGRGALERDATYTYTDGPPLADARVAYEWMHGIGEITTALVDAGLRIERLRESERLPWPRWSSMVPADGGWFRLPDGEPRIPLMYALLASKPS